MMSKEAECASCYIGGHIWVALGRQLQQKDVEPAAKVHTSAVRLI